MTVPEFIVVLTAAGDEFSPRCVEQRLGKQFSTKNEPGELDTIGKFAGRPTPDGHGSLVLEPCARSTSQDILSNSQMAEVADFVAASRACGATDLVLFISVISSEQRNFTVEPAFLTALGALGITVGISC